MSEITANTGLPRHANIVVIGGGIMGCSTLYHLAKAGMSDAILLERNKLTSGTTWHSAAQVRALRSSRNLTDLIRYSIDLYGQLEEETGQQVGWINKGSLSIATNPDRMTHIRRQAALAKLYGVAAETISAQEAGERWPLMNVDDVIGAVWSPDDGRVSPSDLCAALIKGARARGARFFEDTGVTAILTKNGRICGVETTQGRIDTEAIALCTGLWSRAAGAMAGVDVPVWPCEHFYLLTKPIASIAGNLPTLSDHDGHLYIRDDSGGLLVGCFEPMGKSIDPDRLGPDFAFQLLPEDWDHFEPMMHNALHRLPALENAEVRMLLNGPESFTPDGSFLLGEAAETRGLFLGCGMNSVGVATGGGAGMALAHTIMHGAPPMDLHEADPKRFDTSWNSAAALSARVPEILGTHYEITYPGRQHKTARNLRRLPLHQEWQAQNACFGQSFGFERPLYFDETSVPELTFDRPAWFEQVGREVMIAHEQAAIIELSSFGKIEVSGKDAASYLNRVCSADMTRSPGRVTYSLLLNEAGGILSDLTVCRFDQDHFRLHVGSASVKRDIAWLTRHLQADEAVTIKDVTEEIAMLGLMGPQATNVASALGADWLNDLGYFRTASGEIADVPVTASRVSYVGEAGWEISCQSRDAVRLYQALFRQGARPVGSLAVSAMRVEKGFMSYGHDIDTDTVPAEAGLDFTLDWSSDFIGKSALQMAAGSKPTKRIVSLVFDDEMVTPLGNEPVVGKGGLIGKTTSAAFGYRLGKPVALALIDAEYARDDEMVDIDLAGCHVAARVVTGPAFDPTGRRMRKAASA